MVSVSGLDTLGLKLSAQTKQEQRKTVAKELLKKISSHVLLVSLGFSVLIYFSAPWMATKVFGQPELEPYLRILCFIIPLRALIGIIITLLRSLKHILEESFLAYVSSALFTLIAIGVLSTSLYNSNISAAYLGGELMTFIIALVLVYQFFWKDGEIENTGRKWTYTSLLKDAFPLLAANSLFFLMSWADSYILGLFRTSGEVGVFGVCFRLFGLTTIFINALNHIYSVRFAEMWSKNDLRSIENLAQKGVLLTFGLTLPLALILIIFSRLVLGIFGTDFIIGSTVLQMLALGGAISVACGSVGTYLQMTDREKVFQRFVLGAVVLNVILNFIFIPKYGMVAAAVTSVITTLIWNIGSLIWILNRDGIWIGINPVLLWDSRLYKNG